MKLQMQWVVTCCIHCTMEKCTSGGRPRKWAFQQLFYLLEKCCFVNISLNYSKICKKCHDKPQFASINPPLPSVCRNRHITIQISLFFTNLLSRNILSVTNNIQLHVLRELNMRDWIVSKADRWLQSESYSCFIFKWCLKISVIS